MAIIHLTLNIDSLFTANRQIGKRRPPPSNHRFAYGKTGGAFTPPEVGLQASFTCGLFQVKKLAARPAFHDVDQANILKTVAPFSRNVWDRSSQIHDPSNKNKKAADKQRPFQNPKENQSHLILPSLYSTCLRTTGSYLPTTIFSVIVRAFFFVT